MSIGFQHPNVEEFVGDGFEFLKTHKNEFDVIITDSSDPEGPAESLFQKPYFELLRDALRDGGVITTQGCSSPFLPVCLWLPERFPVFFFLYLSPYLPLFAVIYLFFVLPLPCNFSLTPLHPSSFPC